MALPITKKAAKPTIQVTASAFLALIGASSISGCRLPSLGAVAPGFSTLIFDLFYFPFSFQRWFQYGYVFIA